MEAKHCRGCGYLRPTTAFCRDHRRPDGLNTHCTRCRTHGLRRGFVGTIVCVVKGCEAKAMGRQRWCRAHAPVFLEPKEPGPRAAEVVAELARAVERMTRQGYSAKEIAYEVGRSERQVVRHRRRLALQQQAARNGGARPDDVSVWPLADEPPPLDADGMLWEAS